MTNLNLTNNSRSELYLNTVTGGGTTDRERNERNYEDTMLNTNPNSTTNAFTLKNVNSTINTKNNVIKPKQPQLNLLYNNNINNTSNNNTNNIINNITNIYQTQTTKNKIIPKILTDKYSETTKKPENNFNNYVIGNVTKHNSDNKIMTKNFTNPKFKLNTKETAPDTFYDISKKTNSGVTPLGLKFNKQLTNPKLDRFVMKK